MKLMHMSVSCKEGMVSRKVCSGLYRLEKHPREMGEFQCADQIIEEGL